MNMVCLYGNCVSESVKVDKISAQGGQILSKVDVQVAVSRGAASPRNDFLKGIKSDEDFYRCTFFGKTAEVFAQYYSKGRPVSIMGKVLINEFITKKESNVIISPSNPIYNVIRPHITHPSCIMQDGSVVISGNYVVKQPVINVNEFRWAAPNPNKDVQYLSNLNTQTADQVQLPPQFINPAPNPVYGVQTQAAILSPPPVSTNIEVPIHIQEQTAVNPVPTGHIDPPFIMDSVFNEHDLF